MPLLAGQRVLMRVDFNVPIDHGHIRDDSRIRACKESIESVLKQGASLVLMSHLGRPKSKDPSLSLAPCAKRLSEILGRPVEMAPDCVGPIVEKMALQLKAGQVLLLENLRFHPGEENPDKDPQFAQQLARLGTYYINDAFGTAHRAHSSTATIAKYFPGKAAIGPLMQKEIAALTPLLHNPAKPFYAIIGGAKISTKIGLLGALLKRIDALFVGGAMAFTFFKAQGIGIGNSLCEDPQLIAHLPMDLIHLPLDFVITNGKEVKTVDAQTGINAGWQGVDIGPKTIAAWAAILEKGATIFWNGPMGVFEDPRFASGTQAIANLLAKGPAKTIVGGGDSVAAVQQMGLADQIGYLSTGGGACLEFLEFGHLPGIDAIK